MGRSADFTSHHIHFSEEADRIRALLEGALPNPEERARYRSGAYRPLDVRHEAGIQAFKAVARAYGRSFAEASQIQGKLRAEVGDLYALYRVLLLRPEFAPFLALAPEAIQHRITVLRYVHVAIHAAPDLLRIAFEDQPPGMLRTRRNRLEDARQAASLSDPWSSDDVRAWVADEPEFARHLAALERRAKEFKAPKAKAAGATASPAKVTLPADPDVVTSLDSDDGDPPSSGPQTSAPKRAKPGRPRATKPTAASAPDPAKGRAAASAFGTVVPSRIGARGRARPRLRRCG